MFVFVNIKKPPEGGSFVLVEAAGIEPATSTGKSLIYQHLRKPALNIGGYLAVTLVY